MNKLISKLFNDNRLLARAMDIPYYFKDDNDIITYDFSNWLNEFILAKKATGITSVSTTLILPNLHIPTYKNIGYFINGETAKLEHVSRTDSSSRGNSADGDFKTLTSNLGSLDNLVKEIYLSKDFHTINEINTTFQFNDIVGLFYTGKNNKYGKLCSILLQVVFKKMGKNLPLYEYDYQNGKINEIKMTQQQIYEFLNKQLQQKTLKGTQVYALIDDDNETLIKIDLLKIISAKHPPANIQLYQLNK